MTPDVGTALTKVADSFAKELFQVAKGIAAKSIGKLQAEFGIGFETYVQRNQNKCRFVKTLLHRIDPIPIEQAYVEPQIKIGEKIIPGGQLPAELEKRKNVVVIGNGGSGKSMLLKKLFLELCEFPLGRIPLFVELRDLNLRDERSLLKLVHHQWAELMPSFQLEALETGFRTGKFALLLDGLDEVNRELRDEVSRGIIELSYKFPLCPLVLTSRPISDFSSWQEFYTAEIQPFDLPRITELVERTQIDQEVRTRFVAEVRDRLFTSHETFLANPLLCTMMVLTYTEFEEIPSKMHIFYARAFDVLFTRHDKTKTFFNRKFYTTLAEDDFKKLFSTFCLFSYLEGKSSFDAQVAVALIEQVIEFEGAKVGPKDFLLDLHESVSILVKDGDTYSFLHRSFQEYFTAVFLAERQTSKMDLIFDRVLQKSRGDNVLHLLSEMNRDVLEVKFLTPRVRKFKKELLARDTEKDLAAILSMMMYREIEVRPHQIQWVHGPYTELLRFISNEYRFNVMLGDDDLFDTDRWLAMHGQPPWHEFESRRKDYVCSLPTSSIPNAAIVRWPELAALLVEVRAEVIKLDEKLESKGVSRDSFVAKLLNKKSNG
jgi:hypothetical protein